MQTEIGQYRLGVGLEWAYAESKAGVREDLKKVAQSKSRAVVITNEDTGETYLGWDATGGRQKAYAGAALIALATPDALIQHNMSDGNVWICVIRDGHPVPGYDWIRSPDQARAAFDEVFGMFNTLQPYGDVAGSQGTVEKLLGKVDEAIKSKSIKKSKVEKLVLRAPGVDPRVLGMAAAVLALPVLGWVGFKEYQKYDTAKKAAAMDAKLAAQKRMTAEQLEAERRRIREEFAKKVAAGKAEMAKDFFNGQPLAAWSAWTAVRQSMPLSSGGYTPASIDCDLMQCTTAWIGSGKFALIAHKSELGADATDSSKDASTRTAISIAEAREPAAPWQSAAHARAAILDRFLTVQGVVVDPAQAQVETPPPDPALGLSPVMIGYRGAVKAQFSGPYALVQADHAMKVLSTFPVKFKTVKFVGLGKHLTVILDGTYVVPANQ